jgi:Polysaccharide pyruvyl transferase.
MKFGVIVYETTENIGDDIQSYAAMQFLPQIDYFIDREHMNTFQTENDEPVAVIMNGWYMHNKYNFPPSQIIYPYLTSMHIATNDYHFHNSIRFLDGIGGDFLRTFAPVGARDLHTVEVFKKMNIPAYFSGCLTLTLPKQKIIEKQKKYICLVDLTPEVEKKIIETLNCSDIDIKIMTMERSKLRTDWEKNYTSKKNEIENLLSIYQNAKCVITSRLHVSLPCLAMETPVLTIYNPKDPRFLGLTDYLNIVSPDDFLSNNYNFNFVNSTKNKTNHLEIKKTLTDQCNKYVETAKKLDHIPKTLPYNVNQAHEWQLNLINKYNSYQSKVDALIKLRNNINNI